MIYIAFLSIFYLNLLKCFMFRNGLKVFLICIVMKCWIKKSIDFDNNAKFLYRTLENKTIV